MIARKNGGRSDQETPIRSETVIAGKLDMTANMKGMPPRIAPPGVHIVEYCRGGLKLHHPA